MSRWPAFMLFIAVAVWSELPAQIQDEHSNYYTPVAMLAQYEFNAAEAKTLSVVSGTWVTSGGTFNSTSTTTRAIATIDSYIPETPFARAFRRDRRGEVLVSRPHAQPAQRQQYSRRHRLPVSGSGNFYEVSFSPTGSVFVRDVSNGVGRTVATGTYSGGGQNKWFDVEVAVDRSRNDRPGQRPSVVRGIKQDRRTHGRVG